MFNFNKTAALAVPLFAFVQAATAQNSNLVIFSEDAHKFYVIINGVQQNNIAQSNVKITNFEQNAAKVRIVFENNSLNTIDKTIYFNEPNNEWVYNIKVKKGKLQMRYMTYRPLSTSNESGQYVHQYGQPVPTQPAQTTTTVTTQVTETTTTSPNNGNANVSVNTNGSSNPSNGNANVSINSSNSPNNGNGNANVSINTSVNENPNNGNANVSVNTSSNGNANMDNSNLSINMGVNDGTGGANISINVSGSGMNTSTTIVDTNGNGIPDDQENFNGNANVNINMSGNGSNPAVSSNQTTTVTTTTTTTTTNGGVNSSSNPTSSAAANCFAAMSDTDYEQVKKSVAAKSFESEQVIVAKQACKKGCMTASQIKGVMKTIKYDEGRLDFAKFAYPYCIDQSNYYQVNEAFSFSSSVEALDKAINGK